MCDPPVDSGRRRKDGIQGGLIGRDVQVEDGRARCLEIGKPGSATRGRDDVVAIVVVVARVLVVDVW